MANDADNVRLVQDGKIYLAPYGSPAPSGANWTPDMTRTDLGYYSEDGFSLTPNAGDSTEFVAHNGDIVRSNQQPGSWAVAFSGIESIKAAVEAYFDTTVANDGSFTVDSAAVDTYRDLVTVGLDGSEIILTHYPRVKISEREAITSNRTTLSAYGMTFQTFKDSTLGYHFKQWSTSLVSVASVPTIQSATPSGAAATELVTITGAHFTDASAVMFGSSAATDFVAHSDTLIVASMPTGSAGSAAIKVTNPTGDSTPFAYTRGA